jgi:oligopeptide/dipeptide ABC transporter ATP-binding protein
LLLLNSFVLTNPAIESPMPDSHVLDVRDLTVGFGRPGEEVVAVNGVSLSVGRGESVALVGESGCGKSVTALSILNLVSPPGRVLTGSILHKGDDLLALSEGELRRRRGNDISMVFQEPMASLNPVMKIGDQVAEPLRVHRGMSKREAWSRAADLLDLVSIPDARRRLDDYPHQMSGGMRQRVMIAMALACDPELLIADEPTTALDVTIQAQILELLSELRQKLDLAVLLITHDLGVVAEFCERVLVMYAGRIVEEAPVRDLFASPRHPYTRGLLASLPVISAGDRPSRLESIPGMVPDIDNIPPGCAFHPRCDEVMSRCRDAVPALMTAASEEECSRARCFLYGDSIESGREG